MVTVVMGAGLVRLCRHPRPHTDLRRLRSSAGLGQRGRQQQGLGLRFCISDREGVVEGLGIRWLELKVSAGAGSAGLGTGHLPLVFRSATAS